MPKNYPQFQPQINWNCAKDFQSLGYWPEWEKSLKRLKNIESKPLVINWQTRGVVVKPEPRNQVS